MCIGLFVPVNKKGEEMPQKDIEIGNYPGFVVDLIMFVWKLKGWTYRTIPNISND